MGNETSINAGLVICLAENGEAVLRGEEIDKRVDAVVSSVNASGKGNEAAGLDDATGRGNGKGGGCTIAQSSRRAQSGRRGERKE